MNKILFFMTITFVFFTKTKAQELTIGDKVPDFNIGKIINYSKQSLKFSEIKSRLVILNYWSVGCVPCIYAMPKMDSLQKKFGDSIFILPMTPVKETTVKPFWTKNRYTKSTSLPTVIADTIRKKYFPKSDVAVPFEVWILDGKVMAFTATDKVNEKEIRDVLAGVKKEWQLPYWWTARYNMNISLLQKDSATVARSKKSYYATVSGFKPGIAMESNHNLNKPELKYTRALFLNYPIINLYTAALRLGAGKQNKGWMSLNNRFILEVKDTDSYIFRQNADKQLYKDVWNEDHTFCYETVLPASVTAAQLTKHMVADLDKFFGLHGRIEKRKVDCWIVVLKPGTKKITDFLSKEYIKKKEKQKDSDYYSAEQVGARLDEGKVTYKEVKISSVADLMLRLELYNSPEEHFFAPNPPLIDETGYTDTFNVTMNIPNALITRPNFYELKAELNKHGFDLIKGVREIDMLVLTEMGYKDAHK